MAKDKEYIDPFKEQDIEIKALPVEDTRYGSDVFRDVQEMQVGAGATVFRSNQSGIWLGAKVFSNAPFRVDMNGNVTASSLGITGGSLNINNKAIIDSNGNATFISMTSLNMKAYTDFETAGRFIVANGGSGTSVFGNQGVTVSASTTATSYSRTLWWITNYVFNNNPSFTCSLLMLGLNAASGDAAAFVGLGRPTISGAGITGTGANYCGFLIQKVSGVVSLYAQQCDGSGTATGSTALTTLQDTDSLELFLKMTSTGINYYFRLNGGALSAATTLTATMPSGSEQYIMLGSTNKGTAFDFQIQAQCAAYEH